MNAPVGMIVKCNCNTTDDDVETALSLASRCSARYMTAVREAPAPPRNNGASSAWALVEKSNQAMWVSSVLAFDRRAWSHIERSIFWNVETQRCALTAKSLHMQQLASCSTDHGERPRGLRPEVLDEANNCAAASGEKDDRMACGISVVPFQLVRWDMVLVAVVDVRTT